MTPLFPAHLPLRHGPQFTEGLATWCARRIPHVGVDEAGQHRFGPCWAVGVMRRDRLAAVVVLHDWQPGTGTVQLSCASERPGHAFWATSEVVGPILGVAFLGKLGAPVRKVWTAIPSSSGAVVAFNEHLGLKREGTLREHFAPKVHAVVCSIMEREWRGRYGDKA